MAKPVCTYCAEFQGVLLVTNLDDGETQVVCGNDLVMYSLSFASQLTQGMTPEQSEAYGELLDQIRANDARPPKPAGRRRTSKAEPAHEPPPPPVVAQWAPEGTVALPEPCQLCGSKTATGDAVKLVCDGCDTVLATADEASE